MWSLRRTSKSTRLPHPGPRRRGAAGVLRRRQSPPRDRSRCEPLGDLPPGGGTPPRRARRTRHPPHRPRAGLEARVQEFLQEHNRNRPDSNGRRTETRRRSATGRANATCRSSTAQVHFPGYRIERSIGERHEDVELFTPHYRRAHAVSRAKTGFRIYVVGSRGGAAVRAASAYRGGNNVTHQDRHNPTFDGVSIRRGWASRTSALRNGSVSSS